VNSSTINISPRRTIIQKVIVLGENPALMAGFVNRASGSNIAYHLYASLGVGIGVARTSVQDIEIIMQLWLIPRDEKVPGINQNFRRGHTGAIIVVDGAHIDRIHHHLSTLGQESLSSSIIAIVGNHEQAIAANSLLAMKYGIEGNLLLDGLIDQAMDELGNNLLNRYNSKETAPLIIRLDHSECPEYHHVPGQAYMPECTQDDIEYIKYIAERIGTTIREDLVAIDTDNGTFNVNLRNGGVTFSPLMCKHCSRRCKRESRICIIGIDKGWASEDIGERALLILAKVWGIASLELPQHVQKQIRFASQCREYIPDYDSTEVTDSLSLLGYHRESKKRPLLEEAGERVTSKRMSSSTFEVLKSKLQYIRGSNNQDGT